MTKIGIYGRSSLTKHKEYIQYLCALLESKKIPFCLSKHLVAIADCQCTDSFSNHEEFMQCNVDLLISLGGDGTILDTLTLVKNSGIPVLGINLGRLGFLANTSKEETEKSIYSLERNSYQIEKRMLLELNSNFPLFKDENYALNEMTIQRSNSSSMIIVNAYMNGELFDTYGIDGL
ncbi:MAG: NAD(+)/NADH kinase [Bacteroidetes bacterium]|nr:NAD(+)/NADH kinase [Bacteroidota bacterium]